MQTGFLRRFVDGQSYGFIALTDGSNDDVYVHAMELRKAVIQPSEGDQYGFDVLLREDGRARAVNLKPLSADAGAA